MRIRLLAVTSLAILASTAMAQDPVKVDPTHYKVVLENDEVRVIRVHYSPHDKSVMHHHPGAVAVFLSDGKVKFTSPDGKSQEAPAKAGEAVWTPAQDHLPENIGDTALDVMLVEIKTKAPSAK